MMKIMVILTLLLQIVVIQFYLAKLNGYRLFKIMFSVGRRFISFFVCLFMVIVLGNIAVIQIFEVFCMKLCIHSFCLSV